MEIKILTDLMARAAHPDSNVAAQAKQTLAKALVLPVKESVWPGDIFSDLFTIERRNIDDDVKYPTDIVAPGQEGEFEAYAIPSEGAFPERIAQQDYLRVFTYAVGAHIEIPLEAMERGDYNMLKRAMDVLTSGITMKMNHDCWRLLIRSAAARNSIVYDNQAAPNRLSKRLIGLLQIWMRRYAGGNSNSLNRFKTRRVYMSPELGATALDWSNAELDPWTRREVVMNEEGHITSLLDTEFVYLDELGVGQEFNEFYKNNVGGTFAPYNRVTNGVEATSGQTGYQESKTQILLAVDTAKRDRLVMPVVKDPVIKEDTGSGWERRGLASYFTRFKYGVGCLDNRILLLGAA